MKHKYGIKAIATNQTRLNLYIKNDGRLKLHLGLYSLMT